MGACGKFHAKRNKRCDQEAGQARKGRHLAGLIGAPERSKQHNGFCAFVYSQSTIASHALLMGRLHWSSL